MTIETLKVQDTKNIFQKFMLVGMAGEISKRYTHVCGLLKHNRIKDAKAKWAH